MYENVFFELWNESTFLLGGIQEHDQPFHISVWHMLTLQEWHVPTTEQSGPKYKDKLPQKNSNINDFAFVKWDFCLTPSGKPSDNHKIQEIPPPILWPNEFLAKSIDSQEEPQVEFLSSLPLPEMFRHDSNFAIFMCAHDFKIIWETCPILKWVSPTSLETFGIHQVKTSLEDVSWTTVFDVHTLYTYQKPTKYYEENLGMDAHPDGRVRGFAMAKHLFWQHLGGGVRWDVDFVQRFNSTHETFFANPNSAFWAVEIKKKCWITRGPQCPRILAGG